MALPQMPDDEDHVKDADRAKDGDNENSEDGEVVKRILGARRGHVLTAQSILKSEHFPMLGTRFAKPHIQNSGLEVKERAASSSMSHADDSGEFCPCPPMDHSKLAAVQASVPKTMARTMTTMMNVHGAPNFRCAPSTPVYGVAQPTVSGLRSLQRLLLSATDTTEDDANYAIGANDATDSDGKRRRLLTWICIRDEPVVYLDGLPMVLREARRPLENMRAFTGISAERVEALESRLVQDIRDEMNCHDGLIVVHEEHESQSVRAYLMAPRTVQTTREVFEDAEEDVHGREQDKGEEGRAGCRYHRLPMSHEQSPTEGFIDGLQPLLRRDVGLAGATLVVSGGMGIGRTSFAMAMAVIHRQQCRHLIGGGKSSAIGEALTEQSSPPSIPDIMLRLMGDPERALTEDFSTVDWACRRQPLMDELVQCSLGNYQVIRDLLKVLEHGPACKALVDHVLSHCDALMNVRTQILVSRIAYAMSDDERDLSYALDCLERYFALIVYAHFLLDQEKSVEAVKFTAWLREIRPELFSLYSSIRQRRLPAITMATSGGSGNLLKAFRPIHDLSIPSQHQPRAHVSSMYMHRRLGSSGMLHALPAEEQTVVKHRAGVILSRNTILKSDHWDSDESVTNRKTAGTVPTAPVVEGAPNFRKVQGYSVFGVAQPTVLGMRACLGRVMRSGGVKRIVWINLREEPMAYVRGEPYVLRDHHATLRNIKAFQGISCERLEAMEEQLRRDILQEAATYQQRLLVHDELVEATKYDAHNVQDADDAVVDQDSEFEGERSLIGTWLDISNDDDVCTSRQIFYAQEHDKAGLEDLQYHRVPMTAEDAPDWDDLDKVLDILTPIINSSLHGGADGGEGTAWVFNCQMGRGRSTLGTALALLVIHARKSPSGTGDRDSHRLSSRTAAESEDLMVFEVVTSLVRMLPCDGQAVKDSVDRVLGECSAAYDLRASIHRHFRRFTVHTKGDGDEEVRRRRVRHGRHLTFGLKRYFLLLCFQAYLGTSLALSSSLPSSNSPSSDSDSELIQGRQSFKHWMRQHDEIRRLYRALADGHGLQKVGLPPSTTPSPPPPPDSQAMMSIAQDGGRSVRERPSEYVRRRRRGSVLAPQTILKFDHFPGCHRLSLPSRIEGAPNFRGLSLYIPPLSPGSVSRLGAASRLGSASRLGAASRLEYASASSYGQCPRGLNVYGVAMPTKSAIVAILAEIQGTISAVTSHATDKQHAKEEKNVCWVCLREEPVVYVDGRPYALRIQRAPNDNVALTGIDTGRLASVEERLREEVRREAQVDGPDGHRLLVHYEHDGRTLPQWLSVPQEIQTMQDIFDEFENVEFHRLPITDEQAPLPAIFDQLLALLPLHSTFVFNCQMGRGRTTTAMIVLLVDYLIRYHRYNACADHRHNEHDNGGCEEEGGKRDDYRMIKLLTQLLSQGTQSRRIVDEAVDLVGHVQNLRDSIGHYRAKILINLKDSPADAPKDDDATRDDYVHLAKQYLLRYFYLVAFAQYLLDQHSPSKPQPDASPLSFQAWLQDRREIGNLARRLHEQDDLLMP